MKRFVMFVSCVAAMLLSGCIFQEPKLGFGECPIEFTSGIEELVTEAVSGGSTRASDTEWHAGDAIGIYMVAAGGTVEGHTHPGSGNVRHVLAGGRFVPHESSEGFSYPGGGRKVDFVAYYPHTTGFTDHLYLIDVADQSDPTLIDFLYSDNSKGYSSGTPHLIFRHRLTKIVFNVVDLAGASLEGMDAGIDELPVRGTFDLSRAEIARDEGSNAVIPARRTGGSGSLASYEAIVIPSEGLSFDVSFALADGATAYLPLSDVEYQSGYAYIYNVSINSEEGTVIEYTSIIVDWNKGSESDHEISKIPGDTDPPVLFLEQGSVELPFEGGSRSLAYSVENPIEGWVANADVSAGLEWIMIEAITDEEVNFTVTENSDAVRTGKITLSYPGAVSKVFTIRQQAAPVKEPLPTPVITLESQSPMSVPPSEGIYSVGFSVADAVEGIYATAVDDADWITVTPDSDDNCTIDFGVSVNTGAARSGKITISYPEAAPVTVTIYQAAGTN